MIYAPDMTLRDARELYFRLSNFAADGGYDDRWIKLKVWRLPFWLPNVENRREAVKLHDIHHVLTEYPTTWRGETEISAWELGSGGLGRYWAGWLLDLWSIAMGLVINPRGVYRAFMRGRQSLNLYAGEFSDELLENRVGDYRRLLRLDRPLNPPRMPDRAAFLSWVFLGIVTYLAAVLVPLTSAILIGLWILFR